MGFVNRVVPPAQQESEVEELAQELFAKPSVPVAIIKEHVNAVTRAMSAGITAFADGNVLLGTSAAEESRAAARTYRERLLRRRADGMVIDRGAKGAIFKRKKTTRGLAKRKPLMRVFRA